MPSFSSVQLTFSTRPCSLPERTKSRIKTLRDRISRNQLRAVLQMRVNIRRRREIAVTEPFLNLLHLYLGTFLSHPYIILHFG